MTINNLNIIIPAFNEEAYVYNLLKEVCRELSLIKLNSRIIAIDDGSSDNTYQQLLIIQNEFKHQEIIILKNDINHGKGFSIRRAFEYCLPGIIIIQDSDMEYSPSEYKKLIEPIVNNKADVVYGSRFQGSEPKRVLYYTHYVANRFLTTISNIFTGLNLSDMETCYKAFRTDIINKVNFKENRFGFEPEFTAKVSRIKGIRIVETGISYFGRTYDEGKKIKFKDAIRTFYCIFKYNILEKK